MEKGASDRDSCCSCAFFRLPSDRISLPIVAGPTNAMMNIESLVVKIALMIETSAGVPVLDHCHEDEVSKTEDPRKRRKLVK